MFKIYSCIATQHNFSLVILSVLVCALSSFTGIKLLRHALKKADSSRYWWAVVGAMATGFGIWATHFIAMLSYSPGIEHGYDVVLTVGSLIVSIWFTSIGFLTVVNRLSRFPPAFGALAVSAGIVGMHFTGMAAYELPGRIHWNPVVASASVGIGCLLAVSGFIIAFRNFRLASKLFGALFLTLAICAHHFIAMAAVVITPDPLKGVPANLISTGWISAAVSIASFTILTLAIVALRLDVLEKRRQIADGNRLRSVADASNEGLVICRNGIIVTVNKTFRMLTELSAEELVGLHLKSIIPAYEGWQWLPLDKFECEFRCAGGLTIPVELQHGNIEIGGTAHEIITIRDLRFEKETTEKLNFLERHDVLTGLPNRRYLSAALDELLSGASPKVAVHLIEVDRFKQLNDIHGHQSGDLVLIELAHRIRECAGAELVARSGGDEFVVVQKNVFDKNEAEHFAAKLASRLCAPIGHGAEVITPQVHIGIVLTDGLRATCAQVFKFADLALENSRNTSARYCVFSNEMDFDFRKHLAVEERVSRAVNANGFKLNYQPIFSVEQERLLGFEALIRLDGEDGDPISPDVFLPVAEKAGLLDQIGEWVLREACSTAMTWPQNLIVAVNLSPSQFDAGTVVQLVSSILTDTGLDAFRLELEVTENLLLEERSSVKTQLEGLKALGVKIAMDDFGTGYSSLGYLWKFPFDKLKIDRSFMLGFDEAGGLAKTVMKTVIGLGRQLAMRVTVEGVESAEQVQFLKDVHADQVQGFYYSKPMTAEDTAVFILHTMSIQHHQTATQPVRRIIA